MSQPIQEPTIGLGEDIEAFGYKQELRRGLQLHDVVLYCTAFCSWCSSHRSPSGDRCRLIPVA